jgi:phytanoyl-CoA hydroxylase
MALPLSESEIDHYWEHGYVLRKGLLQGGDLKLWRDRLDAIVSGAVPPAKRMLVMRDVMVARGAVDPKNEREAIAKIQDFEGDPVLDSYNQHEHILDAVEQIIGPDIQSIHCMLINKPPNVDGRHPLHQDLVYFPFRPADAIVASWTALEPVTRENGCLVIVPGTHRGPLHDHENMDWEHVNSGYWGAKGFGEDTERVHLECEPGDTVFFHPVVLHGSGRNKTQGFRRAISCHYSSTRCDRIFKPKEVDASRCYRHLRGALPEYGKGDSEERPGQPDYTPPKSTRRA